MGSSSDIKALQASVAALTARVAAIEKIVLPPVAPPVVVTPPPVVTPPVVVPPVGAFRYPASVVGTGWKVTLESGLDVAQPALASYKDDNFRVSDDGNGAQLRCHYGAGHTANSENTRCEWREMTSDGKSLASWSTTSGHHELTHVFTADKLYDIRPITVLAQIHDSKNDLTVFRLEGNSLFITNGNATHTYLVTSSFPPESKQSVGFIVDSGEVQYTFNDKLVPFVQKIKGSAVYFRAGNYAQANATTAPGGKTTDYSQVTTYGLTVSHTA